MSKNTHIEFILLLLIATFFMGSSFPTGKFLISIEKMPPFFLGGVRFLMAGFVVLCFCVVKYGASTVIPCAKNSRWRGFSNVFLIGLFQTTGAMGFLNLALMHIDSALASVLFFTNPLWVLLFAHYTRIDQLTTRRVLGLILGIIGVFLCLNIGQGGSMVGIGFALLGAISWALCTILTSTLLKIDNPAFSLAGWQMLWGGVVLVIIAIFRGENYSFTHLTLLGVFNLTWLILPASVGSFSLWFVALQKGGVAKASSFLFLTPMFATTLAMMFLGETLTPKFMLGCLLIFTAIYIINRRSVNR